MWFCPLDGTLLQVQIRSGAVPAENSFFYCSTCPYSCSIDAPRTVKTPTKRKVVDDILGGAAAWENVDRTMAVCPACNHNEAYFMQMQIRSADEPMSIFYKCVQCSHQWNDK
ncbi:RNA polymerase C subunit 11 kDa [Phaeodactylum tricornutum CCAP 1055/1]|jgi:DNA-directed RNA polymerase III subunit RPC11|uniref:DNA-directed RNA polymerase subunit n=2 Tax=Phaeodactylum tricornutum TaxID=2850 RepID=B5Y459_PHATC|nr:RNA polymerase C subunit 11 kDa [Phaeodactylum tricornutum CCAP 1055/1]ACI65418.1 RNA polymerase C subunit 11 kDa [Phaeodactylum tricornutum CCAP 1055/1]|eukprot:XP_002185948.1 RNA polymerase C subunit 11 kDa [Phaeodactylum tricornutum CCAP 1055/1]